MKKFSIRYLILCMAVLDIALFGVYALKKPETKEVPAEQPVPEFSIQRICELAMLECFYHNVSEWSDPGNFIGYGKKKLWIEYDGKVRVGIKASQVQISEPDENGLITVTLPTAIILDKDLDEDSMYEIDSESKLWGVIPLYDAVNTEERKEAVAEAQKDMEENASSDEMILTEAEERAKRVIEKNIVEIGEKSGKQYKVKFVEVDETEDSTEESD